MASGSALEYYMVHDAVWQAAGDVPGMLCIGCLDARLVRLRGFGLSRADMMAAPVNTDAKYRRSPRLAALLADLR